MTLFQRSTVRIQSVLAGRSREKWWKTIIFQYTKQAGTELETHSTCPVLAHRGAWHYTRIEQLQCVPKNGARSAPWNLKSVSQHATFLQEREGWAVARGCCWCIPNIRLPSVQQHVGFLELKLSSWIEWKYHHFTKMYSSYSGTWIWVIESG